MKSTPNPNEEAHTIGFANEYEIIPKANRVMPAIRLFPI